MMGPSCAERPGQLPEQDRYLLKLFGGTGKTCIDKPWGEPEITNKGEISL